MPSLVQKVPYERAKCFQLEMVSGHHSMCPERERNGELNLTKFSFLIIFAIYFTHFSFKRRKKSLLEVEDQYQEILSDKMRTIINLAAYELNPNITFQPVFPTASPANFSHFVQQLNNSPPIQRARALITFKLSSRCLGGKKRRRCFVIQLKYFVDGSSSFCLLMHGFGAGLCMLSIDLLSLGVSCTVPAARQRSMHVLPVAEIRPCLLQGSPNSPVINLEIIDSRQCSPFKCLIHRLQEFNCHHYFPNCDLVPCLNSQKRHHLQHFSV